MSAQENRRRLFEELRRQAHLHEIRAVAQGRIKENSFHVAERSRMEIGKIGLKIAEKYDGYVSVPGVKGEPRASQKVLLDYDGDWYGIKDLARMTIIVKLADCQRVVTDLQMEFTPDKKRGLIQVKHVLPEQDPCGYSSTTVFVKTSFGMPGEIQVNTPELIFAKQSQNSVTAMIGPGPYQVIQQKYALEGGLGHALYEVFRVAPASDGGKRCARVSKQYYAYFRVPVPLINDRDALQREINELRADKVIPEKGAHH